MIGPCPRLLLALLLWFGGSRLVIATPAMLGSVSVLEDPLGLATLEDVERWTASEPGRFRKLTKPQLAQSYSRGAFWLRFTVEAPPGEWWLAIQPPYLDDLRLYSTDPAHPDRFVERRTGDRLPFARREVNYRGFVFKLQQTAAAPAVYYLRLQTSSSAMLALQLWEPSEFQAAAALEYGLLMGELGILLAIFVVDGILWFWLRDRQLLAFLVYLGNLVLMFFVNSGFAAQYVFPTMPSLTDSGVIFLALLSIATGDDFYRQLFGITPNRRGLYWLYRGHALLALAAIPPSLSGHAPTLLPWIFDTLVIMLITGLWLSFRLWRDRKPGGGAILIANGISLFGFMVYALTVLGILGGGTALLHSPQMAAIGVVLVMHLALSSRLQTLREERERAREHAVQETRLRAWQSEFFAMMSHELKTPLAVINGAVDALETLVPAAPAIARRHDRIRRAVARLNSLVERVLRYDQLVDRRQDEIGQRSVDLEALARDTTSSYGLSPQRLELSTTGPCRVRGDRSQLATLLTNLIDNALKFTPANKPVRVTIRQEAAEGVLEVQDQGPGIAPADRDAIFERYRRGSDAGDIPGAGLGLYLVREISARHGGEVVLFSPPAGGAIFQVNLPLAPESIIAAQGEQRQNASGANKFPPP